MVWRLYIPLFTVLFNLTHHAIARSVLLEWEAIPGATSYEVEVSQNGEKVVNRMLDATKTTWNVGLPVGVYVFRMRASDWTKQPGEWSDPAPFVSSPAPPEIIAPTPGDLLSPSEATRGVVFRWKPIGGIKHYQIEIRKDGQPLAPERTSIPGYLLKNAGTGEYEFRVACVLELKGALPLGLTERFYPSEPGVWLPFSIKGEPVRLPAPKADPLDEPENSFSFAPVFTAFQISAWDRTDAAPSRITSKVNTGGDIRVAKKLSKRWSMTGHLQLVSTSVQDFPAVTTREPFIANLQVGMGFRPHRAKKVDLRFLAGIGDQPTIRGGATAIYEPISLIRLGLGVSAPLFTLAGFQFSADACLLTFLSRVTPEHSYRNGLIVGLTGVAQRPLSDRLSLRGFTTFTSTYINTNVYALTRNELQMGGGLSYRF